YRAAQDAVETGAIGNLLVLRAATHDPVPPPERYIAESGGIFRDLHIHDFDAIRFVTGQEIVEVYADGAVRETPWFSKHDDVDTAAAVLRLRDRGAAILAGGPRGAAQSRRAGDRVGSAARRARLRRAPRGVRVGRQHRRRQRCTQPAALGRGRRTAG